MASNLRVSSHGSQRMAQRNISPSDVELILAVALEVEGGFLVRKKDCQALERRLKALLTQVQRLRGKRLVVSDGCLITAYRASRSEEQRLLRRASL